MVKSPPLKVISIIEVLMLSSILAATDPVAVVAILEEIGAPQRLRIIIEGESLLNDGLSIFAYTICASYVKAESKQVSPPEQWYDLLFMCGNCLVLSPFFGLVLAHFVVRIIRLGIRDNKKIQVFLLITVYIIWFIGEHSKGSPAVIIVFYGVALNYMRESLEPSTVEMALQVWASFGYWANCVIFTFGGYYIGSLLFNNPFEREATYMLISGMLLYPFSVLSRMLAIYVFKCFWESVGSHHIIYESDYVLLAYGGLKGALALLLAHDFTRSVHGDPVCEEIGQKVVLYCSAAVGLCLLIQGMTFSLLTKREGTNHRSRYIKDSEKNLEHHLNNELRMEMERMRKRSELYLTEANWKVVNERIEANVFKGFSSGTGSQSRVQISEECSAHTTETLDEFNKKDENRNVCAGYYSILLARVHDLWIRGALSGSAAHIMIELLEQGIDEEKLGIDDFMEHLSTSELNFYQEILLTILTLLKRWIDKDTWLNRLCQNGEPFLRETLPNDVTVIVPSRDKERWSVFSAFICLIHSILLNFAIYHPMRASLSYPILVLTFFISMVLLIEELFYFHRFRKPLHRMELDRFGMRCFSFMSRFATEMCYCGISVFLIIGAVVSTIVLLGGLSTGSCLTQRGKWSIRPICSSARAILLIFYSLLCILKIFRVTPLLIFTLYEALYVESLLRVRVQLSALYSLQYLLSQPPVTFHLFPDNAFKVALVEQKYLNKIVDALIRRTMKQNEEILDLVPVIKTRQAIRMASHTLHNTIAALNAQGLIHEESMAVWGRYLKRLRDDGDKIVMAPEPDIRDVLEYVHWIAALEPRKRQIVINKLADYFEVAENIFVQYNQPIRTFETTMFFIKKGICRVTEASSTKVGSIHRHEYYLHQGRFIGERNLLNDKKIRVESIKKPKVIYQTTTDCHLIEVRAAMMEWIRNADHEIIRTISAKEQRRRIVYELKEHNQLFSLMTMEDFDKLFKLCARPVSTRQNFEVDAGKKLIVGWRTLVCSVKPLTAFDDHYQVNGPASVILMPVGEDEGMILLIDNIRGPDQATSDEPESNLSLSVDDSDIKKKRKKVEITKTAAEQAKQISSKQMKASAKKKTNVPSKVQMGITRELVPDATQLESPASSRSSRRTHRTTATQSEMPITEKTTMQTQVDTMIKSIAEAHDDNNGKQTNNNTLTSPYSSQSTRQQQRKRTTQNTDETTQRNSSLVHLEADSMRRRRLTRSSLSAQLDKLSPSELKWWIELVNHKLAERDAELHTASSRSSMSEAKVEFGASQVGSPKSFGLPPTSQAANIRK
uniref:Cation/H+ exchanger domain-containing protein n=1 Tax=Parascaris univalens TaxID=6257 RepID=A0A915C222_PARUN